MAAALAPQVVAAVAATRCTPALPAEREAAAAAASSAVAVVAAAAAVAVAVVAVQAVVQARSLLRLLRGPPVPLLQPAADVQRKTAPRGSAARAHRRLLLLPPLAPGPALAAALPEAVAEGAVA